MVTSVYMSNNNIQAVVGAGGKKIKIKKMCSVQIPEGSLINGIITNEAELADQLKAFWKENSLPRNNVELVVNSSQLTLKELSFPKANDKKMREMIPLEFSNSGEQADPVYDYMVGNESGNMIALHAVMTERAFVQGYVSLFASIGVTVTSMTTGRVSSVKFLQSLKQLRNQTCIVMNIDNASIGSSLWSGNSTVYSTTRRVFSEPGSEQFGAEIARTISNILQFASTQNLGQGVREIYLTGVSSEDFEIYSRSVDEMESGVELARLELEKHIKVNKKITENYADYMLCIGNMLTYPKDINLIRQAKKKTKKKSSAPVVWKKYVAWPAFFLVVCGSAVGVLAHINYKKTQELNAIEDYLNDPVNIATDEEALLLETKLERISQQIRQIQTVKENIESYPHMNSTVVERLQQYAAEKDVALVIRSYSADSGTLSVDAKALEVTLINRFIDTLQDSGLFDDITYTGYTYNEEDLMYTINVTCYLAENAGK